MSFEEKFTKGSTVVSTCVAAIYLAIVMAMLRCDPFWIANALYLSLAVGAPVSSSARLLAYRRGF